MTKKVIISEENFGAPNKKIVEEILNYPTAFLVRHFNSCCKIRLA
jgi:hypothetical protein